MNYDFLIEIKYHKKIYVFLILIIITILTLLSIKIYAYDTYLTYGVYDNCLVVNVPTNNSDSVLKGNYLQVDNKKYTYKVKNISELQYQNEINYQTYEIIIDEKYKTNEVKKITFFYNKEKIIKKIINFIFGKEKKWI